MSEINLKPYLLSNLEFNILPYWMDRMKDENKGGFYGEIDSNEQAQPEANKGVILNTRILWTFSAAELFFKEGKYAQIADRAYKYIRDFFLDKKYGGVFWELNSYGNPVKSRKQIYAQAFAVYSLTEYYQINKNPEVLDLAIEIYRLIEKYSLDKLKGGYIEAFREDWSGIDDFRLSEKDLNAPKTMNTHLHILEAYTNLYKIWKTAEIKNSLGNIIRLFLNKFLDQNGHLLLFFNNDWNRLEDFYSFGHDIEFSWLLTEAAEILSSPELIDQAHNAAGKIAAVTYMEGFDKKGGLNYEFNYIKNYLDAEKHWWVQAEALVGFYNAWQITGDSKYLEIVDKTWDFIDKNFVDHKNGEWFAKIDPHNEVIAGLAKVDAWKCPYHNSRALLELLKRME